MGFLSFANNCVYDDDIIQPGLFFIAGHLCGETECQSDILADVNDAKIGFGFWGRWGWVGVGGSSLNDHLAKMDWLEKSPHSATYMRQWIG